MSFANKLAVAGAVEKGHLAFAHRLRRGDSEMAERFQGEHAAPRCAADKALLQQVRFNYFFNRILAFAERGRDCLDSNRAAAVIQGNAAQIAVVHGVEAKRIHLKLAERGIRDIARDLSRAADRGEIADAPQQPARNAGRAPAAPRNLAGAIGCHAACAARARRA